MHTGWYSDEAVHRDGDVWSQNIVELANEVAETGGASDRPTSLRSAA